MSKNPNPERITNEMWEFVEDLEALEPADTQWSGSYVDKPGYHNTRQNLLRGGLLNNYSIQLPDDKLGPADKCAAIDWTFITAQLGNFTTIRKYGYRIRDAFFRRDPRLLGWREVLIQGDEDDPADGYDFIAWSQREPSGSHRWHGHFSKLRRYVADKKSYDAMISILKGQSLLDWLTSQGDDIVMEPYLMIKDTKTGRVYACFMSGQTRWLGPTEFRTLLGMKVPLVESATPDEIERLDGSRVDTV